MESAFSDLFCLSISGLVCLCLALGSSVVLAVRRCYLDKHEDDSSAGGRPRFLRLANRYYSFLFNFSGSLAGWFFLLALWTRARSDKALSALGWVDLVLFLFGFVGITGHLPETAYGLVKSIGRLVDVAADRIGAKANEKSPGG